ncbi:hypothetical protein Q7P37_002972 [Cladosporium fusiforme]
MPQFSSQHSQAVLNVSEDHSSSIPVSPAPKQNGQTQVEQSPEVSQHTRNEAQVRETAERVEDSYKDSVPREASRRPDYQFNAGDEEISHSGNSKGNPKGDATAATMSAKEKKPAALLSRNLFDELLEEGAVAVPRSQKATINPKLLVNKPNLFAPAGPEEDDFTNDATITKGRKEPNTGTMINGILPDVDHRRSPSVESNAAAAGSDEGTTKASDRRQGPRNGNTTNPSADIITVKQPAKHRTGPVKTLGPSKSNFRGRPQRQAKQTALNKLKDKAGDHDLDSEASSEESASPAKGQKKGDKNALSRGRPSKQLPTPIMNGNVSNKSPPKPSQGKLKPISGKPSATTENVPTGKLSIASKAKSTSDGNIMQKKITTKALIGLAPGCSSPRDQVEDSDLDDKGFTTRSKKKTPEKGQPSKRPGALKRPARTESRGRKPLQDSIYDVPSNASPKGKRRRKLSKASIASSVKPGPTRQRMQPVSFKERTTNAEKSNKSQATAESISVAAKDAPALSHHVDSAKRQKQETGASRTRLNDDVESDGNQGASSISKNLAKTTKVQQLVAVSKPASSRQKPGSSQANAIAIEQDDQSSSSPDPSPMPPKRAIRTHAATRPQTPAMLPSSPPGPGRDMDYLTLTKDKPAIIAFGKQGPLNQGASAQKRAGPAVWSRLSSSRGEADPDASPSATKGFPSKTQVQHNGMQYIQPKPLAHSGASAGRQKTSHLLAKESTKMAPVSMLDRPLAPNSSFLKQAKDAGQRQDDDDGFAVIDDFEGTTFIDDATTSAGQRTASQIAMPPPDKACKKAPKKLTLDESTIAVSTKKTVDDDEDDGVYQRMLPSVWYSQKAVTGNDALEIVKTAKQMPPEEPAVRSKIKQAEEQKQRKRRHEQSSDSETGFPSKKARASRESTHALRDYGVRRSAEPVASQVKQGDPVKRVDRRRSRRMSESFPGVDILGSPYPKDLDVPTRATALEAFSQQAGISPDESVTSEEDQMPALKLGALPVIHPSESIGRVSSNGKPVPAAPQDSSKAVSKFASGSLAQHILATSRVQLANSDPFTKTHGPWRMPPALSHANHDAGFEEDEVGNDHSDSPATTHEQQDENPYKTLVDQAMSQRISSEDDPEPPGVSTANIAAASKALEDVGDWRNTLKPHQTHLFDSLVVASHKLVRHIVDKETAQHDIVADYYRRGDIVVKELQSKHAKEYQQYLQKMETWKKRAADQLAAQGRELRLKMKEAERAREERKKARRSRAEVEDVFEELLAGLS